MKAVFNTIDDYILGFQGDIQLILHRVRETIRTAAPEAAEKISYGMPTFYLEGNLVHFAAHKNHLGFYPAPSGLEAFRKEIAQYKNSKGAVQFPFDQRVPYELIARIVRFRVAENLELAATRKQKRRRPGNEPT
jgi:uncharacterized protein YdhG (YjbR/CyaY superfamily)